MKATADFLVELFTEELPPKSLQKLAKSFLNAIVEQCKKQNLNFKEAKFFATPRRLAVLIHELATKQPNTNQLRKGPALSAAFDQFGKPTPACNGFAKSCGIAPEALQKIETEQGQWVGFEIEMKGKTAKELLPGIVSQAISLLPISKKMRWGNNTVEFVRPVHNLLLILDDEVIPANILNCSATNFTYGHRFLSPEKMTITHPSQYEATLLKHYVIADYENRKKNIHQAVTATIQKLGNEFHAVISDNLLDEVTSLVEWPVALLGTFDDAFLKVPAELLISAMEDHQRYFPIKFQHKLAAHFVVVSNIKSKDEKKVIAGNERVLRARLADAVFFFEKDKQQSLEARLEKLKTIVFQAKLGSLHDKAVRISKLTAYIAEKLSQDKKIAERAGLLAKTDLTTEMVGEFPELQGIAGYYYALHDKEDPSLAEALKEQYMPRFSGDALPESQLGSMLALADKIDNLIGVFAINQAPTGDKDPYGLRRAALGILRILIEKQFNLDLKQLLQFSFDHYTANLENKNAVNDALNFLFDRLKFWYQEQAISVDIFSAVTAIPNTNPYDIHCRIQAVAQFKAFPEASSLSVANKRVSNILSQYQENLLIKKINHDLFENDSERALANHLEAFADIVEKNSENAEYLVALTKLATLREPIDDFFDKVMVMTDDKPRRENRLLLLKKLRELFLKVADVGLLG